MRFAIGGLITAALLLSACGPHHPLGIPEEKWESMDADAQHQARLKQAEVDRAQAQVRQQEAQARQAEAAAQAAELSHARATAGPGERVQCVLDRAELHYGGKWRPAEPIGLDLVAGMPIEFELRLQDENYRMHTGMARFDGMEVRLCPDYARNGCARMVATQGELRRGKSRQVTSHEFLRGRLQCELTIAPDHPNWDRRRHY